MTDRHLHAQPEDITPSRLTPIDVVTMTEIEVRATLVHLTGNPNPVVRDALLDAARGVFERTRLP